MDGRNADKLLLIVGILGLALTLLIGVYASGASAARLATKVETAAKAALTTGGFDWADASGAGQRVVLVGLAPSETARAEAVEATKRALGSGGVFAGGVTRVVDLVEIAPLASPFSWKASVESDGVVFSGHVPSREAEAILLAAAQDLYPAAQIDTYTTLASGAPSPSTWSDAAKIGLASLSALDPGVAELTDDVLTLRGVAVDLDGPAQIDAALATLSQPFSGLSLVTGRFGWGAEIVDGDLVLSGQAPDAASQRALADMARRFFPGDVDDRTTIGGGADWTSAVRAALPQFASFSSGRMQVAERALVIEGRATESVYDYLRADMDRAPQSIGVQYDVVTIAPQLDEIAGIDLTAEGEGKRDACQQAFTAVMSANRIYFETNQAVLNRRSGETLDKLATVARACSDLKIEVSGHTDDRGRRAYNIDLSQRRAGAVSAYLIGKGAPPDQIVAVGYGPDRPATDNATPEGRASNRRIEFTVLNLGEL